MTGYDRRTFLKNSASFLGRSLLSPDTENTFISKIDEKSDCSHQRLYPYQINDYQSHFIAVTSHIDSVDKVIEYSTQTKVGRSMVISNWNDIRGLGSTALMLVSRSIQQSDDATFLSADEFVRKVTHMSSKEISRFRERLLQADSLYIDSVQFLSSSELTVQHLLLEMAYELLSQGRPVIFTIGANNGCSTRWIDGFHKLFSESLLVTLPYPPAADLEEIVWINMLIWHKEWVNINKTMATKVPAQIVKIVSQSNGFVNIRELEGATRRFVATWGNNTNIEQHCAQQIQYYV